MAAFTTSILNTNPLNYYLRGFGSTPEGQTPNLVDRYFRENSWRLHQSGFIKTYHVVENETSALVGLFALSCGSALLPDTFAEALLKDPILRQEFVYRDGEIQYAHVPTIHINYFALDRRFQGKKHDRIPAKYSDILMHQAFRKAGELSLLLGAMFLELEALDARAFSVYHRLGFRSDAGGIEDLDRISFDPSKDDLPKMLLPMRRLRG